MTRLGLIGVTPLAKTGYGRVMREIARGLMDRGHEVYSIGHAGGDAIVWGGKGEIPLGNGKSVPSLIMDNPLTNPRNATLMVKTYVKKYNLDLLLSLWDSWALSWIRDVGTPYIVYIPIDGQYSTRWASFSEGAYKIVAMARYGYDQITKFYAPSQVALIEHGVDVRAFSPSDKSKSELRDEINADANNPINRPIPRDTFLFTSTAANHGHRKGFMQTLETFKKFHTTHPQSDLYLHTNIHSDAPAGYALEEKIQELGLQDSVHYPSYDPILEPVTDSQFKRLYCASDVYLTASFGEGFGLPVMESMACGLPVICPNNSSMTELVQGHGFLVDCLDPDVYSDFPVNVPTLQRFFPPSMKSLLEQMEKAYKDETLRIEYGKASREFAQAYSWDKIIPKWQNLLGEVGTEISMWYQIRESIKAGP